MKDDCESYMTEYKLLVERTRQPNPGPVRTARISSKSVICRSLRNAWSGVGGGAGAEGRGGGAGLISSSSFMVTFLKGRVEPKMRSSLSALCQSMVSEGPCLK